MAEVACEGANYGSITLDQSSVSLVMSAAASSKQVFDLKLDNASLCVVTMNNKDEMEIHFHEREDGDREEDCLVQMTLHFPKNNADEEDEEEEDLTLAEKMKQSIFDSGVLRSATGNIIAEFSKDQGNFVTPRGKYGLQLTSEYMHMQGAQYSYKIKYSDISSLYLLPKLDGGREAFIIGLEKPIRQGNQKYQNLVLETHKIEHTMTLNITEEEIQNKYQGQLSVEMTMPTSHLIAKIFKVLSKVPVFVSKHFVSARQNAAVRCSIGSNEGTLYPLAKTFIFINKPTIILKFDEVESVEFKRYDPAATSAIRNFDLVVTMKTGTGKGGGKETKEYSFNLIDRSEYKPLFEFLEVKKLTVKNPVMASDSMAMGKGRDGLGLDDGEEDEEESDDEDYEDGGSDDEGGESGDDSGDEDKDDEGEGKRKKKPSSSSSSSGAKKATKKARKSDEGDD